MGIIIGIFFLLFLVVYSAPTREQQRLGRESFQRAKSNYLNSQKEYAAKHDYFFNTDASGALSVNENFYSDGSLRRDNRTGTQYQKGQYYCNGYGRDAKNRPTPDSVPRPPKPN